MEGYSRVRCCLLKFVHVWLITQSYVGTRNASTARNEVLGVHEGGFGEVGDNRSRRTDGRGVGASAKLIIGCVFITSVMAAILSGLSNNYNTALSSVAGILAIKIGALNLLTVRSRLITGDMASGKEGGISQRKNQVLPSVSLSIAIAPSFH